MVLVGRINFQILGVKGLTEGPEGVKWELGFAYF